MLTRGTPIAMAPERGGATARDRSQDGSLLHTEPGMLRDEGVALRVEEIGHLQRRPAHAGPGFRFRRDRGRTTGAGTCSCSSGLGAACKWRRETWRYTVVCDRSAWPSSTWIVRRSAPASSKCVAYECLSASSHCP